MHSGSFPVTFFIAYHYPKDLCVDKVGAALLELDQSGELAWIVFHQQSQGLHLSYGVAGFVFL